MAALKSNWQSNWPGSVALVTGTIVSVLGVSVLMARPIHFLPVAQVRHEESQILLLSRIILVGGIVAVSLVALAVYLMVRARLRTRELESSEEHFRELFEQGPIGIALLGP